MYRPKDDQERIKHRLQIALGHLKKVLAMTEKDAYCIDILHQSQAVQKALSKIDNLVLENHLRTCVALEIRRGNDKEVIAEVMKVMEKR